VGTESRVIADNSKKRAARSAQRGVPVVIRVDLVMIVVI
jgi:hypothetical protein